MNQGKRIEPVSASALSDNVKLTKEYKVSSGSGLVHRQESGAEIDLLDVFSKIWAGKFKIGMVAVLFGLLAAVYSLSLPNIYSSTIKLIPSQQDSGGDLSSLASKYGGLAAMAGINLGGGEGNSIEQAVELMESWPFIESFVDKHDLKATFMAAKAWDAKSNTLIFDDAKYDVEKKQWLQTTKLFSDVPTSAEPSSYETFLEVRKNFVSIGYNAELGILTISFKHYSPYVAYELTEMMVNEINEYFRQEAKKEALASISFIEKKITNTSNTDMKEVFYNMIESHTQTVMLTEIREEYLVKTLIPAKVSDPKGKVGPKRAVIVLLAVFFGVVVSSVFVLVLSKSRKEK